VLSFRNQHSSVILMIVFVSRGKCLVPLDGGTKNTYSIQSFRCRNLTVFASSIAVVSIGIGNALVLIRMILLWENKLVRNMSYSRALTKIVAYWGISKQAAKRLLIGGFLISISATAALMATTLVHLWGNYAVDLYLVNHMLTCLLY
jgi:hypothetical protein